MAAGLPAADSAPVPPGARGDLSSAGRPKRPSGLWRRWRPLLLKELRETLRDTRTIGTLFIMPVLVYPLLSLLMQNFIPRSGPTDSPVRFEIAFDSAETLERMQPLLNAADRSLRQEALLMQRPPVNSDGAGVAQPGPAWKIRDGGAGNRPGNPQRSAGAPPLPARLPEPESLDLSEHQWQFFDKPAPNEALVQDGVVDLILVRIPNAEDPDHLMIEMIYDPTRDYSRRAAQFIAMRIERYNLMQLHTITTVAKLPSVDMVSRLETRVEPVAKAMVSFATIVPLILIMMTITGAVYPAIDLTAGERERGTLESLMAAPLPRVAILAAKYVAVWVVAMLTASLNVASMLGTLWVLQLDTLFLGEGGISVGIIGQIFLLLALFAWFFSAILLVVTSLARSFKEAQAYLIPLMMLSLTPGALALMPDLESELWLSLVPMVNLVVLARDVMLGAASVDFACLSVVSTLLYSAAALGVAAQVFGSDAVLYGSQGNWRELWQGRPQRAIPTPAFSLLLLALLFPAQFVILGIMGRMQGWANALTMVGSMSGFTAVLFLVLPVLAVLKRGYQVRASFALQLPSLRHSVAGLLLGIGLWPLVGASLWGLGQLRAWLLGTEAGAWSDQVVQLAYQQLSGWSEIPLWVLILALAVVPAVCEEFFFRGVLLQSLRQKNGDGWAILASGLAFGLFHFVVESSVAPLRFVVTASMGTILAWVCVRSGSLWPSIILHGLNNGILTGVALVRESLTELPNLGNWVTGVSVACLVATVVGFWLLGRGRRSSRLASAMLWGGLGLTGWSLASASTVTLADQVGDHATLPAVAEGWQIQPFATDDLAPDIHCVAIGPNDEVFVAGPGYIAQLIDSDQDGIADRALALPIQPREGPQGLWVERDSVWFVADGGIWQVERPTGGVRKFVELPKTGGEHDAHAVRRGRDGHFYLLAGNDARLDRDWITHGRPIAHPRAGVLSRISPSGQWRQVLVQGMRNTYDFDWALDQSFLLYDSDDERDVGLPWYRPTTLFAAREGDDVGWVSRCFKNPVNAMGSPMVMAQTGRGSPTGVACQRSPQWGPQYFGGVAFADWTFGRVYLSQCGGLPSARSSEETPTDPQRVAGPASLDADFAAAEPLILVQSRPGVAFAPTGLEFDRQGNLYVVTGGRQTRGAVYRVSRLPQEPQPAALSGALAALAAWFQQTPPAPLRTGDPFELLRSGLENRDRELAEILQTLSDAQVASHQLAEWQRAGRRLMLRDAVLASGGAGELPQWRSDFLHWLAEFEPRLRAEALTWMAMACGPQTDLTGEILEFAEPGWRPGLSAWATLSQDDLRARMGAAAAARPLDRQTLTWTWAALTLQNAEGDLTAEEWQWLSEAWIADLEHLRAGTPAHLQPGDWQLVWRWALQAPIPHDGNTGPWDYLVRQRTLPESVRGPIRDALQATWETLKSGGKPAAEFDANTWRTLLEIQQLIDLDRSSVALRWWQWFDRASGPANGAAAASVDDESRGWHPVSRLQAMTLLAAAEKPWPSHCDDVVVDFLLNLDRQMKRWNIGSDRNWPVRVADMASLLCRDHRELTDRLARSPEWSRPAQIPLLRMLSADQQIQAIRLLSERWNQWAWGEIEPNLLGQLQDLTQQWALSRPNSQSAATLARVAQQQIEQGRTAWTQHSLKRRGGAAVPVPRYTVAGLEADVDWAAGDAAEGKRLFTDRQCATCHQHAGRLGPSLAGVTRRFSRAEILRVIIEPDSRITDRYRATWIELVDGTMLTGRPVYDSTDGLLLEDQAGKLWQLSRADIESRRPATTSMMPAGLMHEATRQDWADLWAYLQILP